MELNYFSFPVDMVKAGEESNDRIPIEIIPNKPTFDRVNDKILLKAFDEDCIKGFLQDGVIDYDHISILGKNPIDRAEAIIGEPTEFFVDVNRQIPVCRGFLFKGNRYVDNVIQPALKAKSNRFGASLGGKILQKSSDDNVDGEDSKGNIISKIMLKHIAITPLQKAVHQSTSIKLMKSFNGNDNIEVNFSNYNEFINSFVEGEILQKALEAGVQTDISNLSGGQALQTQSLEGVRNINYAKIKKELPLIISDIITGKIGGNYETYKKYLKGLGFNDIECHKIIELLAMNSPSIVKAIF